MSTLAMVPSRCFNRVTVDHERDTVTKSSTARAVLRDERDWYLNLPADLCALAPRVLGWQDDGHIARLILTRLAAPSLALTLREPGSAPAWPRILGAVVDAHLRLRAHSVVLDPADLRAMYLTKTRSRLGQLAGSRRAWAQLVAAREVVCNGVTLSNVSTLWPLVERRVSDLTSRVGGSVIHGDLCFSNILWRPDDAAVWLVDPRGRFAQRGTTGDPRYDAAKLRHSAAGGYDLITADQFDVTWEGNRLTGALTDRHAVASTEALADDLLGRCGYDLDEIRFIEALLFLSMIPLHSDAPNRQAMMYLTGITRLNDVLA